MHGRSAAHLWLIPHIKRVALGIVFGSNRKPAAVWVHKQLKRLDIKRKRERRAAERADEHNRAVLERKFCLYYRNSGKHLIIGYGFKRMEHPGLRRDELLDIL